MSILLDSTVLIDALRGRTAADTIRAHAGRRVDLLTTGINVEEIARGLRPREVATAQALFDGLIVVPVGRTEGWQAGRWRAAFASRGVTLSQADCLIAAAAWSAGATLATGNPRDFPMEEVTVEHWPVG